MVDNTNKSLRLIPDNIIKLYKGRLAVLKKGQEYYKKNDIIGAAKEYHVYLNSLALFYGVSEKNLDPKFFDQRKGISEILLVSHVYWDLAQIYDKNPKLAEDTNYYLDQFVKFTIGFKFHHLNAQMVKRFLKKHSTNHPELFENAFNKIQIENKNCYIATFCYSENHPHLHVLRNFKTSLLKYSMGQVFVDVYYYYSPKIIFIFKKYPLIGVPSKLLLTPIINLIVLVIKKCHL